MSENIHIWNKSSWVSQEYIPCTAGLGLVMPALCVSWFLRWCKLV